MQKMQTFGLNVALFVRFSPEVCIFWLLGGVTIAVNDDCTILDKPIQINGNADGQCYNTDSHRDSKFDDHEEQHGQATADADHVVHEAREYGQPAEEGCHNIPVEDTSVWHVVEYQIKPVANSEEYRVDHQA